jgi:hypothetical protein
MVIACSTCKTNRVVEIMKDVKENEKTYNVFFCKMCNVGFTIPFPSPSELSALYSSGTYRSASGKRFVGLVEMGVYLATEKKD